MHVVIKTKSVAISAMINCRVFGEVKKTETSIMSCFMTRICLQFIWTLAGTLLDCSSLEMCCIC